MAADTHTHTHAHTHTNPNQNLHLCTHKAQNSMCRFMLAMVTWVSISSSEPESLNVLYFIFLFCLCRLATITWASLTALVRRRELNNVARIVRRGMTVREKRRRTWWLHLHVHLHVTLVKETLRNCDLISGRRRTKFRRYSTLVRRRYSSLLGIEL
jgi:hypothetical protein